MEWSGTRLINTGALVCRERCLDVPQEQLRTIILPPDPLPIRNARIPNFAYEEATVRILQYNRPENPPWGAGPQTIRALQNGETPRLLEFSSEDNADGRIASQPVFTGALSGTEIMEIATTTGTPNTPADGRLTSLPSFPGLPAGAEIMELVSTGFGKLAVEMAKIIPLDGRLSSLQLFTIALAGTEAMEMVTPNNQSNGANYQITTALLAAFFSAYPFLNTTKVAQGSTYPMKTSDTRLLVVAGSPSATSIVAPLAATMVVPFPILIKDWIGNAFTNNIRITFTGGELCDGQATVSIKSNYGWVTINPNPGGGGWYSS